MPTQKGELNTRCVVANDDLGSILMVSEVENSVILSILYWLENDPLAGGLGGWINYE